MNSSLARTAAVALRSSLSKARTKSVFGRRKRSLAGVSCCAFSSVSDRGGAIIVGRSTSSSTSAFSEIHLPPADDPVGAQLYKKAIYCPKSGVLRTSAHVGSDQDNQKADGIVGETVTPDEAREHARNSGLRLLATLHHFLGGDLDRVEQVLHLKGMVKSTPGFAGHASVIDGCSEVLQEAFGSDSGVGTRECFGVGSLGATVACTLEVRVAPPRKTRIANNE